MGQGIANRREAERKNYSIDEWYSCGRKEPQTEADARRSAARLNRQKQDKGFHFVEYRCTYCDAFHVGRVRQTAAIEFLGTRDDGHGFIAWFRTVEGKPFGLNRESQQRRMNSLPIAIEAYNKALAELQQRESDEDGDGETYDAGGYAWCKVK